ncbi:UNVERIFIED_ORG: hypothetical protein ABRZ91_002759 [Heyndrickxia coagulans]
MSDFVHDTTSNVYSDGSHEYLKNQFLNIKNKFQLKDQQLATLFGISDEKTTKILSGKPCYFDEGELKRIHYRLPFLSTGFSFIDSKERVRAIIEANLIGDYNLSYETLGKYANVPCDVLKAFCEGNDHIDVDHLMNICVNLLMLSFVLRPEL